MVFCFLFQEDFCELFHSYLNNATGPFNASMCNIRLQSIHCPMGDIKKCFPFVENNAEFYAGCIQNSTSLDILSNGKYFMLLLLYWSTKDNIDKNKTLKQYVSFCTKCAMN